MDLVIFRRIVPRTRPASEFQLHVSPTLNIAPILPLLPKASRDPQRRLLALDGPHRLVIGVGKLPDSFLFELEGDLPRVDPQLGEVIEHRRSAGQVVVDPDQGVSLALVRLQRLRRQSIHRPRRDEGLHVVQVGKGGIFRRGRGPERPLDVPALLLEPGEARPMKDSFEGLEGDLSVAMATFPLRLRAWRRSRFERLTSPAIASSFASTWVSTRLMKKLATERIRSIGRPDPTRVSRAERYASMISR